MFCSSKWGKNMIRLLISGKDRIQFISDTPLKEFTIGFTTKGLVLYPEEKHGKLHILFDMEGKEELTLSDSTAADCIRGWLGETDENFTLLFETHPLLRDCLLSRRI